MTRHDFCHFVGLTSGLLPAAALACETVALGDVHDLLSTEYLGGPDAVVLRELHILDLNGDSALDAYAVTSFWVNGGADDAGGVLYFQGHENGLCRDPSEMSVELGVPDSLRVQPLRPDIDGGFPDFRMSYAPREITTAGAQGGEISEVQSVTFSYKESAFGFAPR